MNDLLADFLSEAFEQLDIINSEIVRFELNPNDREIVRNIFRLMHTIKGTCGFLQLPRLEALAHAAETLVGRFLDGRQATSASVRLVLTTLDRLKAIMSSLNASGNEPAGSDARLIDALLAMAEDAKEADVPPSPAAQTLAPADIGSAPKPGEVSLDKLERAFLATPEPDEAHRDSAPADAGAASPDEFSGLDDAENEWRDPAIAKGQTIRVRVDALERLMTVVSELVLTRNQLLEIGRTNKEPLYKAAMQRLSFVTAELQEGVTKTRMQPIGSACQKLPRLVRDLSEQLGKQIDLVVEGGETELDRQLLESIKDPLIHMVRNSADHGIEAPAERRDVGKSPRGTIRVAASHEGGTISIEISDDGRGLDIGAIRRKADERGTVPRAELDHMSDAQVAKLIFHPGLSTAKAVTSVSGRGVGMNVVKTNIEAIGGLIEVANRPGQGASFTIKIPLTLAIIAALIVETDGRRYAVPQGAVRELVAIGGKEAGRIERLNGACFLRLRDQLLPVFGLSQTLGSAADQPRCGFVMVICVGRARFGLLVDQVRHTEEIVVKPMSKTLAHVDAYAGNTILGDGSVALILDPTGLSRMLASDQDMQGFEQEATSEASVGAAGSMLVFRSCDGLNAVPLSLVTRLEKIDTSDIEYAAGQAVLQYRGAMLPLTATDPHRPLPSKGSRPVVIFSDERFAMGLVIDEIVDIVDIVDEPLQIEAASETPGLIGSAVLRGRATDVIDISYHLGRIAAATAQPPTGASRRILLVAPSLFAHNMLKPMLAAAGYDVQSVGAADAAIDALRRDPSLSVVIYDLGARGEGDNTVDALRLAEPRSATLPTIAICDEVTDRTTARALARGVDRVVSKFDAKSLVSALREIYAGAKLAA